jgi:glycosyltransferase involved in cell wall biosynthesis
MERHIPKTVLFPFLGDEVGGSHVSAIGLIRNLDRARWKPIVALNECEGPLSALLTSSGVDYVAAPQNRVNGRGGIAHGSGAFRFALDAAASLARLTRFLLRNSVDIVHTNDGAMHAAWSVPARLAGARLVWHHRGDPDARGVNLLAPLLASHIVTVSRFAEPASPILPIRHKLSVIHSPFARPSETIDRQKSRERILAELELSSDTRILGYFGALIERKRPRLFIDVVRAFALRYPEIPVAGLLFGVPSAENPAADQKLIAYARELGVADRVFFMGYRSPVENWMSGTEILLVPAVREPYGRTLIEAMFLRTPVIATDSGGNVEAVDHERTGLLVAPDDAEAFVAPIRRLLSDEAERERITRSAFLWAMNTHSVEAHVRQVTELYARLLRSRSIAPGEATEASETA